MTQSFLFDGLNDIDAATAKRRFTTHLLGAGEVLTREGEQSHGLALVIEGVLLVEVDGTQVGTIQPGGMLGEMGLFEGTRRRATVRAAAPTVLSLLGRDGYEELRDTLHPICIRIELFTLANQVHRLRATGRRVAELGIGEPATVPPTTGFFAAVARWLGSGAVHPVQADVLPTLVASSLFAGAPVPSLEPIAERFSSLTCRAGAFLCTEGEVGEQMFVLASGEVEVIASLDDEPHHIATLEAGAAFGMVSLAENGHRMASCVAREGAVVHVLDHAGWDALLNEPYMVGSTFRRAVIRAFSDQLDYSNAQLADYERRSSAEHAGEHLRQATRALQSHDKVVALDT